jgi:hypothetical protein
MPRTNRAEYSFHRRFFVPRRESSRLLEPERQKVLNRFARNLVELEDELDEQPSFRVVQVPLNVKVETSQLAIPCEVVSEVETRFRALAEQWYMETMFVSTYLDKILHPAYQKILTLGEAAIPFILRELQDVPNDWFWALRIISNDDPVKPEQAGDMDAMAEAWLSWGREKGHI